MKEKEELEKLINEGKIKSIYQKNLSGESEEVYIEILKCGFCEKTFTLLEINTPYKIKTNIKKLLYDIKAHLHKHQ
ncbi:MAG: hypothetical protein QXO07_01330 [Candidatus Aenigmatarchaeota archaeon]